ncbi:MAG: hypothetical protein FD137_788, partial [Spirochaetes bacterium]
MNKIGKATIAIAVFIAFALPGQIFAQSGEGSGGLDFSIGDICQIAGGAVALGF